MSHVTTRNLVLSLLLGLILLACLTPTTSAAVIVLTGGDPLEGFSPKPAVYAASDFFPTGGQGALTVQNVTFDTNSSAVVLSGQSTFSTSTLNLGASTNDLNLATVVQNLVYGDGATATVSGLTPGVAYQFDLFLALGTTSGGRNEAVSYKSSTNTVLASEPAFTIANGPSSVYDVANTVTAPSDGIINVVMIGAPLGGDANAIMNALSVTYDLPEPASIGGVVAFAAVMGLRRRSMIC